jgi:hypothetical protein
LEVTDTASRLGRLTYKKAGVWVDAEGNEFCRLIHGDGVEMVPVESMEESDLAAEFQEYGA